jgi:hypothetical protein
MAAKEGLSRRLGAVFGDVYTRPGLRARVYTSSTTPSSYVDMFDYPPSTNQEGPIDVFRAQIDKALKSLLW